MDYSKFKNIGVQEAEEEKLAKQKDLDAFKEQAEFNRLSKGGKPAPRPAAAPAAAEGTAAAAAESTAVVPKPSQSNQGAEDSDDSDDDENLSPLFWKTLPSQRPNASKKSLELEETLGGLVYADRNAATLTEDFRERGNQAFRQKQWPEAESLYTEAMQWCKKAEGLIDSNPEEKIVGPTASTADEDPDKPAPPRVFDPVVAYAMLASNRAAVHLKRKNYRSAIKDCRVAINVGGRADKPIFRGATAALALRKPDEALTFLGKESESEAPELKALRRQAVEIKRAMMAQERERNQREKEIKAKDAHLRQLLQLGGVNAYGPLTMDLQPFTGSNETRHGLGPAPELLAEEGVLVWPALFMYPEHSTSDYVRAFRDDSSLGDVLATMFPQEGQTEGFPEWDAATRSYTVENLSVFFTERPCVPFDLSIPLRSQVVTRAAARDYELEEARDYSKQRLVKIPLDATLREIVSNPKYVLPGIPTFVVVSKASKVFYESFIDGLLDGVVNMKRR